MSDSRSGRFPTPRTMKVDDLLAIYEGILESADKVLEGSQIASALPIPTIPEGAEDYLLWAPHNDPLPPDDITEVPSLVLGKLFSLFQNWTNYVAAEVTRARCIRDVQDRQLKVLKAALTSYYKEEGGVPANAVEDYVICDERFVEVDAANLRIRVVYETAKSREEQLRRTLNNISREQTRRGEELQRLQHDEQGGESSRPPRAEDSPLRRRFGR